MKSGIYAIKCLENSMLYIGSTNWLRKRKNLHFGELRRGEHTNRRLQQDFNTYGEDSFVFIVILRCENYLEQEQLWIEKLIDTGMVYNEKNVDGTGYKFSEESLAKKSATLKAIGHKPPHEAWLKSQTKEAHMKKARNRATNINKVLEIKKMLIEGNKTQQEIANLIGVSRDVVKAVSAGRHTFSKDIGGGLKDWL